MLEELLYNIPNFVDNFEILLTGSNISRPDKISRWNHRFRWCDQAVTVTALEPEPHFWTTCHLFDLCLIIFKPITRDMSLICCNRVIHSHPWTIFHVPLALSWSLLAKIVPSFGQHLTPSGPVIIIHNSHWPGLGVCQTLIKWATKTWESCLLRLCKWTVYDAVATKALVVF